jgi:prefoldin subunit 5
MTRKEPYTLDELQRLTFEDCQNPQELIAAIRNLATNVAALHAKIDVLNQRIDTFRGVQS